jgi:hypothetical protein
MLILREVIQMFNDFKESFNDFVVRRTQEINRFTVMKSPEYNTLSKQCCELYTKLLEHLPEEYKQFIKEYEEIGAALQGISEVIVYTQGLKDGRKLDFILSEEAKVVPQGSSFDEKEM